MFQEANIGIGKTLNFLCAGLRKYNVSGNESLACEVDVFVHFLTSESVKLIIIEMGNFSMLLLIIHKTLKTVYSICIVLLVSLSQTACGSCSRASTIDGETWDIDFPDTLFDGAGGLCGNNTLEAGEECDDGNRMNCDGCSDDCMIETSGCFEADEDTEEDSEDMRPEPPVPLGEPIPVEQDPSEAVYNTLWLHVIWTGEYFSFVYRRICPEDPAQGCLGMRRFGKDAVRLGPDWVYNPAEPENPVVPNEITMFDVCWNDPVYGLAWVENEFTSSITASVYFRRLNSDGKIIGDPILLARDIDRGHFEEMDEAVRIGCSTEGYLVGYPFLMRLHTDTDPRIVYTYLHELGLEGQTTGGAYYGEEDTPDFIWAEGLKYAAGAWRFLHGIQNVHVLLERIDSEFNFAWRTAIQSYDLMTIFDMDVDDDTGKTAVTFSHGAGTYFALIDGEGEVETNVSILEEYSQAITRITAVGNDMYAILWTTPLSVSSQPFRVEMITASGVESESVEVCSSLGNPYAYEHFMFGDIVWTGEEIAVVVLSHDPASSGSQAYLQLLQP